MRPGLRLCFMLGCVLVASLHAPDATRTLAEDLAGPYAQSPAPAAAAPVASAPARDMLAVAADAIPLQRLETSSDDHDRSDSRTRRPAR